MSGQTYTEFFQKNFGQKIKEICERWDKVEGKIKEAEVISSEVCFPSINELRYAGRRLVDALNVSLKENKTEEDLHNFYSLINECHHFCARAEHDAIDSVVLFLDARIDLMIEEFGLTIVHKYFPKFLDIRTKIREAQKLIVKSREDRDKRSDIYDEIYTLMFGEVLELYTQLEINESLIKDHITSELAKQNLERKWQKIHLCLGYGIGVFGIVISIVTFLMS